MKYLEILAENALLRKSDTEFSPCEILILNNITVQPVKEYLELQLRMNGLAPNISFGNYDNILQDALSLKKLPDVVVVFWEAVNFTNGLEYKSDTFSETEMDAIYEKISNELLMVLDKLKSVPLLMFNQFSSASFSAVSAEKRPLEQLVQRLNLLLSDQLPTNGRIIDVDKIFQLESIKNCVDVKGYYKNKTLYKHGFYLEYARRITFYIRALKGKVKKALVLDCDNTLWNGVIGEDGLNGIKMGPSEVSGLPFHAFQHAVRSLGIRGTIISLCSKNNESDVIEVLQNHPDLVLTNDVIVSYKINWQPKSQNIRTLIDELNIGADSVFFVDDSAFEREEVSLEIPEVNVRAVPAEITDLHWHALDLQNEFISLSRTQEDLKKINQYKENAIRAQEQSKYKDLDSFLKTLNLKVEVYKDNLEIIERMAQMTQKTNQFNLTTKRYGVSEIERFVKSPDYHVYAFRAIDKFGDSGITGMAIVALKPQVYIDSLLMSCRILGRNIEKKFMAHILDDLVGKDVHARFIPTKKNMQVANFYEGFGFDLIEDSEEGKLYCLRANTTHGISNIDYITLVES